MKAEKVSPFFHPKTKHSAAWRTMLISGCLVPEGKKILAGGSLQYRSSSQWNMI